MVALHVSRCFQLVLLASLSLSIAPLSKPRDEGQLYGRNKRTIWNFPYKQLLKGATRTGQGVFSGRKYHKQEGFTQARHDFMSVNPRNVELDRDGDLMGEVQDKILFLHQLGNNAAILQVYPKKPTGAPPILSILYDTTQLYP